ncbi:saccharopine dehydrogenase NADP-binding domain-containing protein [Flavobacteriaceae bacterium S0825]|uniref:saccharopine dehydrogenase C-terminal domain-containing protein n=1 Tax=Gaetbulibacter sp. S0825 TaxID=2720084 RepID=UPI001430D3A1|nr:saccharopine dehydrogenase C-terminal domain-containing protein [Gaetbulibacter sp. S0825]MCK0108207.1 saccharopine dehydrogenase NADP-binding domain-containing protein [Flavobacteriaceae bacterium S0825]NIX63843.1 NAD(P)-binding domain-containing protein [Gaetbulibacter sp. S0825]
MKNIIVLGAGMVGSAMAIDLAKRHKVTLTDVNLHTLEKVKQKHKNISFLLLDVTNKEALKSMIKDFDLVICAVPGFLGYETLKAIIKAEKNVIDISFFPENSLELDTLAKEKNVTAIVDCGVAPGMDNVILGYYNEKMKLTDFECLVGGLPKIKKWPFCYKAPFSPVDVIEEYTRPARYVENSQVITREALTDCEYLEFDNIGTLESFNSDGLRSIIYTMPHIPNMKEKTLRYPGHVEYIKVLKESGFFSEETIEVNGNKVTPLDFTSKVLFNEWKLGETEEELTVMRVTVKGENDNGKTEEVIYNLYDEYCPKTETSSMSRSTGYTATAAANLFLEGLFIEKGVFPPELVGKHEVCFNYFLSYLKERGVVYKKTSRLLE